MGKRVGALKCSRYSSVVYEGVGIDVDGNVSGVSAVPCVIRFYRSRIVLLPLPLGSHAFPTAFVLCAVRRGRAYITFGSATGVRGRKERMKR